MPFYAHTDPNSSNPEDWEPLFTPFGDGADECQRDTCEKCARLDRFHGHLNKVAWWTAKFSAEMFPPGPDRDAAWQWGYVAGLWHDLGKFAPKWQEYLKSKADPHTDEMTGKEDHSTAGAPSPSSSRAASGANTAAGAFASPGCCISSPSSCTPFAANTVRLSARTTWTFSILSD